MVGLMCSRSAIIVLFFRRCPPTVGRLVVTVIVDAVDGKVIGIAVGIRPVSERLELLPLFADLNASAAVAVEGVMVFVLASTLHAFPDSIKASAVIGGITVSSEGC